MTLPAWEEFPDLEIYMDQLTGVVAKYLAPLPGGEEKGLTPSMVNNYVKHGYLPAPVNKKYGRQQLSYLLILCVLKSVLPLPAIGNLLHAAEAEGHDAEALYTLFREEFIKAVDTAEKAPAAPNVSSGAASTHAPAGDDAVPASTLSAIFGAALSARAAQDRALLLLDEYLPKEPEKEKEKDKKLIKKGKA